jgi:hypothetical protein
MQEGEALVNQMPVEYVSIPLFLHVLVINREQLWVDLQWITQILHQARLLVRLILSLQTF